MIAAITLEVWPDQWPPRSRLSVRDRLRTLHGRCRNFASCIPAQLRGKPIRTWPSSSVKKLGKCEDVPPAWQDWYESVAIVQGGCYETLNPDLHSTTATGSSGTQDVERPVSPAGQARSRPSPAESNAQSSRAAGKRRRLDPPPLPPIASGSRISSTARGSTTASPLTSLSSTSAGASSAPASRSITSHSNSGALDSMAQVLRDAAALHDQLRALEDRSALRHYNPLYGVSLSAVRRTCNSHACTETVRRRPAL